MIRVLQARIGRTDRQLLVLVRHGESVWNRKGLFTGLADVELTFEGRGEAEAVGRRIATQDLAFDMIFTSTLIRARESAEIIRTVLCTPSAPIVSASALNERDYGELTGLDEATACQRFGVERVDEWRYGYAERPPCGESLMDVRQRVARFHNRMLMPEIAKGKRLLIVGHGNSLRALVMELERMSPEEVEALRISTAEALVYAYAGSGSVCRRKLLRERSDQEGNELLK